MTYIDRILITTFIVIAIITLLVLISTRQGRVISSDRDIVRYNQASVGNVVRYGNTVRAVSSPTRYTNGINSSSQTQSSYTYYTYETPGQVYYYSN